MTDITLTTEQVDAVLQESLHREYWELDTDGNLPRDPKDRKTAASDLIKQCRLSYRAGNRTDGVLALLHLAEDDLVAGTDHDTTGERMAATAEVDLSEHSLESLKKFETALLNYPQDNEEVQQNLSLVRAEILSKGGENTWDNELPQGLAPTSTPEHTQETKHAQSVADAPAAGLDRDALVDQISFGMMRAHSIDPSDMPNLSVERLQEIIANPGGAQEAQPVAQTPPSPAPPAPSQPEPSGETIETTRMVIEPPPEPVQETPQPEPGPKSDLDPVREELESQITGPMLKAFGRGRLEVPEIGINELRFMIENPEGRVTQEQLAAAKALDAGTEGAAQASPPEPAVAETEPVVTQEPEVPDRSEEITPPTESADSPGVPLVQSVTETLAAEPAPAPQRITKAQAFGKEPPANPAQEIIDQEGFPTPPEIDEKPPRLPFDMSKLDDDSLRSLHAQMHAVHSRANFIVGLWEGELRDIVKLRRGEEVRAANEAPTKDPDDSRKRLTDAQRESIVAADAEVVRLKEQEHGIERILRQLKALRDGYSSDVSTCSRQWAMRKEESAGAR